MVNIEAGVAHAVSSMLTATVDAVVNTVYVLPSYPRFNAVKTFMRMGPCSLSAVQPDAVLIGGEAAA